MPSKRFMIDEQRLFSSALHWQKICTIFAILTLTAVIAFQLTGLTQNFFFNEELTQRHEHYTFDNFLRKPGGVHYTPLGNLITTITYHFFAPQSPWSHAPLMALYWITMLTLWVVLQQFLQRNVLWSLLACLLFFSMPTLSEGTYWLIGSHGFLSVTCFCGYLFFRGKSLTISIADQMASVAVTAFNLYQVLAAFLLLIMLSVSPLTYLAFFLIVGVNCLVEMWQRAWKQIAFWMVVGLAGLGYLALRNWILNESPLHFSHQHVEYGLRSVRSWRFSLEILVEILEYGNPLLILQRIWPAGELSKSPRDLILLLHLLWFIPLALDAVRLGGRRVGDVLLYGLGAALTLMMLTPNLALRYFIPVTFAQTLLLMTWLNARVHFLQIYGRGTLALGLLLIILSNCGVKWQSEWQEWWQPKRIEKLTLRNALEDAENTNVSTTASVFLVYHHSPTTSFAGGSEAGLMGLRKLLEVLEQPRCLYYAAKSSHDHAELKFAATENAVESYLGVALSDPQMLACGAIPTPDRVLSCWLWNPEQGMLGDYVLYTGDVYFAEAGLKNSAITFRKCQNITIK